jgi:phage gp46-like protein
MNFGIEIQENGRGRMTWERRQNALVNVYWSVKTPKGSFFADPDFGLDLSDVKKVTPSTVDTIIQRYEQALSWMIDARKARAISVNASIPNGENNRIDVTVEIVEMDGTVMQFATFVEVGGVSGGFVFP